jgi:hypothetical protein
MNVDRLCIRCRFSIDGKTFAAGDKKFVAPFAASLVHRHKPWAECVE